jgi:small conductance mechanosensitive channel
LKLAFLSLDGLPIVSQAAQPAVWDKLVNTGGDFLMSLAGAVVILLVTIWGAGWAGKLTHRALGGFNERHAADPTLRVFMASLARNAVYILGGVAVLSQLGVKTTSIIAAIGAASLAIGLAMQGALSNVAAGVMIFLFRPYRVGDVIESAGRTGRVRSLDLFVTELATLDNLKIVIPNSKMFGDVIINHSFHDRRRADAVFRAPLKTDVTALMDKVRQRLEADPRVLEQPAPLVEVTGMSEVFVEIAVRPWAAREDYGAVKADVMLCARLLEEDPQAELPPTPDGARPPPKRALAESLV